VILGSNPQPLTLRTSATSSGSVNLKGRNRRAAPRSLKFQLCGSQRQEEEADKQQLEGRILHSKMSEDRRRRQDRNHQVAEDRRPRPIDSDQKQNRAGDLQNRSRNLSLASPAAPGISAR